MQTEQQRSLYELVVQGLTELIGTAPKSVARTVLLRDRFVLGQRFTSGPFHAIWLADEEVIKFCDGAGRLLKTISLDEPARRLAA